MHVRKEVVPGHRPHCHLPTESALHFIPTNLSQVLITNSGQHLSSLAPARTALLKAAWTARSCTGTAPSTQMCPLKDQRTSPCLSRFAFSLGLPKQKPSPYPSSSALHNKRLSPKAKQPFQAQAKQTLPWPSSRLLSSISSHSHHSICKSSSPYDAPTWAPHPSQTLWCGEEPFINSWPLTFFRWSAFNAPKKENSSSPPENSYPNLLGCPGRKRVTLIINHMCCFIGEKEEANLEEKADSDQM